MKEKIVTDALPGFNTGLKTIVYTAYQHYCLGMSISKIRKTLKIHAKIRGSTEAVYADETGFRQKGKKFWLWMFAMALCPPGIVLLNQQNRTQ